MSIKKRLILSNMASDIASTGEEGLAKVFSESYDLVLLDLMLPGIDGFELCRKIRDELDIRILMVTARKEDIDKIRGFDRGADDYIQKPFNPSELMSRVKAHLSRYNRLINRANEKQVLEIGDLVIEQESRKVFVNEQEKILTAKEFDLLLFLETHPNRVFSKENLFERIWG